MHVYMCAPAGKDKTLFFAFFYDERLYVGIENNCSTLDLSNSIEIAMYHNS